jgi:hypothetical protein
VQLDLHEPARDFEARGELPTIAAPLVPGALGAFVACGCARAVW